MKQKSPYNGKTVTLQRPDMELWVDKKTGLILKRKVGTQLITVTKVDFAPKFTADTFKVQEP